MYAMLRSSAIAALSLGLAASAGARSFVARDNSFDWFNVSPEYSAMLRNSLTCLPAHVIDKPLVDAML